MRWPITFFLASFLLALPVLEAQSSGEGEDERKRAIAIRVSEGVIEVDGALDEQTWTEAPPITDFIQKEPHEGAAPTERIEVRFLYSDDALYVGARMYTTDPSTIQAPLGRRNEVAAVAEHILVSFDTFLDRRTAYSFGVTASGIRLDHHHPSDSEDDIDRGFDPVWEVATRMDELGWTAEFRIPFTQLRFNDQARQVWGLNVKRFTPTLEEEVYWVMVPRTERAWASRFGELHGIKDVPPTRRLELLPFVAASATIDETRDPSNPFDDGRNLARRAGLNLKMGLGPNLTLDVAANPDFGQVEADPAEVNLTQFPTRFRERRPFFAEGSELLQPRHPNIFYSRRIGEPPAGRVSGDFTDHPTNSRILGAAKLTGRLRSGTSLGILSALTDQGFAQVANFDSPEGPPEINTVRVGTRTGYGVARVLQDFGESGSNASVMVGAVYRDLEKDEPLASFVPRTALVFSSDALVRFRGGEYEWSWSVAGTYLGGEPGAIERVQRSSSVNMQRPDRTYSTIDPTRRSLSGWSMITSLDRISGQHWLFGLSTKIDNPTFEPNDIGNLRGADEIRPSAYIRYRETQPGSVFRSHSVQLSQTNEWNFGGDHQQSEVRTDVDLTWLNFWRTSFSHTREFRTRTSKLTRGGPIMAAPAGWESRLDFGNRSTVQTQWSGSFSISRDELGGRSSRVDLGLSVRPGPRWQLSARPSYSRRADSQQYVTTLSGGRPETFGNRYIFAYIDRSTYSTELRMSLTLSPDLNLDVYAEPFAASGRYYGHGELFAPGSLERITYGEDDGTELDLQPDGRRVVNFGESTFVLRNDDFNVRSFNTNVVLRSEWRPGSTVYLVWQQNREIHEATDARAGLDDIFRSVVAPGSNTFLFKASFWLPAR